MFVNTDLYSMHDFPINLNLQYLPNPKEANAFAAHIQNNIEILSPVCGSMIVTLDTRDILLEEGDVIIVNPMELHSGRAADTCSGVDYFCLHVEPAFFLNSLPPEAARRLRRLLEGQAHFRAVIPAASEAARTMQKIFVQGSIDSITMRMLDSQCRTAAGIYTVLTILLCDYWEDGPGLAHRTFTFIQKVTEYVERSVPSESLTTANISRALSYSESYFCRRFRKVFGTNFADWCLRYRIERACRLSSDQGLTLSDIAARCGFSDYAHYSRTFKAITGLSPRDYRRSKPKG